METHLTNPLESYFLPLNSLDSSKTIPGSPRNSPPKAPNLSDNLSPWSENTPPDSEPSDYDSYLEETEAENELIHSSPIRSYTSSHWAEPWSKMNDPKPVENSWDLALTEPSKASHSDWTDWPSTANLDIKPSSFTALLAQFKPTIVGAGLANLGNTCFLNAVLQCFTHTVPLIQGIISCNHKMPCAGYHEGFCVICAMGEQIQMSVLYRVVAPWKFVNNLNYFSSGFGRFQQEDAHEFLQCFLDKLESSVNCTKPKEMVSSQSGNFVKQVFGGRLVSKLQCCNCGHCSDTYEPSIDLSLEIEDADTLSAALDSFTKVEKIEDPETKFTCEKCKEQVFIEKQLMLDQAPSVAVFHLKRFKNDGSFVEKIDKFVGFPMELDLHPYIYGGQMENAELKYDLYAVVVHIGFSSSSGHYYCFIRSAPDAWYKLDDSKVVWVQDEDVLSQEAYILFYAKRGTPWFAGFVETQRLSMDLAILHTSPKSVLDNVEVSASSPSLPHSDGNETCDTAEVAFPETFGGAREGRNDDCDNKENLIPVPVLSVASNSSDMPSCGVGGSPSPSILKDSNANQEFEVRNAADATPTMPTRSRSHDVDATPNIPTRSASPDIYREDPPDSTYSISRSHLKSVDQVSCKRQLNKDLEDSETKQACKFIKKSIPGSRGQQLLAAMRGSHSESSLNKKRGRIMHKSASTEDRNSGRKGSITLVAGLR